MAEERFSLELPASAVYVGTARIFVGAVSRQSGVSEEHIDDIKLAVSEACSAAVRDDETGVVRVTVLHEGARLSYEIVGEHLPPPLHDDLVSTPESFRRSVGYDVVRSLFPGGSITSDDEGAGVVRFSVEVEA